MATETIITEANGGKQSDIGARFDLLPPLALREVARVLAEGASKYAENNWRLINVQSHLNHAMGHLAGFQELTTHGTVGGYNPSSPLPDALVEELSHAACRMLMALDVFLGGTWEAGDPRIGEEPPDYRDPLQLNRYKPSQGKTFADAGRTTASPPTIDYDQRTYGYELRAYKAGPSKE